LRCSGSDARFPQEVVASAAALLTGLLNELKAETLAFSSELCTVASTVMKKLLCHLDPKDTLSVQWSATMRLLGSCVSAKQSLSAYMELGAFAATRIKKDSDGSLLKGLVAIHKTLDNQCRQVPEELLDGGKMADAMREVKDIILGDAPLRYEALMTEADAIWEGVVDPKEDAKRTLSQSFAGTCDGSDWHSLVGMHADYASLVKVATTTILTMSPVKFKKAVTSYQDMVEKCKVCRESYDVAAKADWEAKCATRIERALTTAKEGVLVANLIKHKDDPDTLQSTCKAEKRSGERAKPNSWHGCHERVKHYAQQAVELLAID